MKALYWNEGVWSNEPVKTAGPGDLGLWAGASVFDGARAIGGCVPDLTAHCERLIRSARNMLMDPPLSAEEVEALCIEAVKRLPVDKDYYLRPVLHTDGGLRLPSSGETKFSLAVFEAPMPASGGFQACLSTYRRPAPDTAPTDAKAGALYPNSQRAQKDAVEKGCDLAVMCDGQGNVAEFNYANLWFAKDGIAITPKPNGTFLDGITKNRVAKLLGEAGVEVCETTVTPEDLADADEIFSTGNLSKVWPCVGYEGRALQPGPIYQKAHALYQVFTESARVV